MTDIVQTGICPPSKNNRLHKVLRPGYKLQLGTACHDGRPISESWRYQEAKRRSIPIVMKRPPVAPPRYEKNHSSSINIPPLLSTTSSDTKMPFNKLPPGYKPGHPKNLDFSLQVPLALERQV